VARARCKQPVNLFDLYPSLIKECDLPRTKQKLEWIYLVPIIMDEKYVRKESAITYSMYRSASVRTQDWKYIRYYDGTEELYDENKDPWN